MIENYVVIDLEMTGLSSFRDKIIEIGMVKVCGGIVTETYEQLVNPNVIIPEKIEKITKISNKTVEESPYISDVIGEVIDFIGNNVMVGHNLKFDFSFLMQAKYETELSEKKQLCDKEKKWYGIDTLKIARKCLADDMSKRLEDLCIHYHIEDEHHHRALNDAMITKKLYEKLCEEFETKEHIFLPEQYTYKPKKERIPSRKEIERVERIIARMKVDLPKDIYRMSQSELSRYADKLLSKKIE